MTCIYITTVGKITMAKGHIITVCILLVQYKWVAIKNKLTFWRNYNTYLAKLTK